MNLYFHFDNFLIPFAVCLVLFFYLNTNAVVEYCKLFGLRKLFLIDEFEKSGELDYSWFLAKVKGNFLFRLLACPTCFGFWLNVCLALAFDSGWRLFAVHLWLSLFLYFLLNKISK